MLGLCILSEMMVREGLGIHMHLWDNVQTVLGLGLISEVEVK